MELQNSDLRLNFPFVIKNQINNWKVLHYTEENWCTIFQDKLLKFRKGQKNFTETPNWEHLCESEEMLLKTFFELSSKNLDYWLYYDYKYLKDILPEIEGVIDGIKWTDVGLNGISEQESVLWIGNKGAHTPCHKDTYGCNLVAQLYGRKLWILIPPKESENLKPVRVPYEESSIYSLLNFYAPKENLQNIKEAYKYILCPGDVLYVPLHWWHYVENLETAISINIWIPLEEDHESRLEESLVRYYISNICQDLSQADAKKILNPNEYSLITEPCPINIIEKCLESYKMSKKECQINNRNRIKFTIQGETDQVEKLHMESFIKEKNSLNQHLFMNKECCTETNSKVSIAKALINTYCTQDNINSVKKALLDQKRPE